MNVSSNLFKNSLSLVLILLAMALASCGSVDANIQETPTENKDAPSIVVPAPDSGAITNPQPNPSNPTPVDTNNPGDGGSNNNPPVDNGGGNETPVDNPPVDNGGGTQNPPDGGSGDGGSTNPPTDTGGGGSTPVDNPPVDQGGGSQNPSLSVSQTMSGNNHSYQVNLSFQNTLGRVISAFELSFIAPEHVNQVTCWSNTSYVMNNSGGVYVWKPTSAHYMVVQPGETRVITCQIDLPWKDGSYTAQERMLKSVSVVVTQ